MKSLLIDCAKVRTTYTNLNRKDFSKAINIPYTTYLDYEKGRNPDLETIIKISDYIGVSIDTLLEREKKDTPAEVSNLGTDQRAIQKLAEKLDDVQASQVYNYMLFVIDQKSNRYENYNF